jgi:Tfp pilus assembly protein PilW
MGRVSTMTRELRTEEGGWTLIELLVASLIAFVVIGGAVTAFLGTVHSQPKTSAKAARIQEARFAIERLTRELRQGSTVSGIATATQLSLVTYVHRATCGGANASNGRLCQVAYACSAGVCTRGESNPGTVPSSTRQVVSGLSSSNVFSYRSTSSSGTCDLTSATAPAYVCVTMVLPSTGGGNAITLNDGVALRNVPAP